MMFYYDFWSRGNGDWFRYFLDRLHVQAGVQVIAEAPHIGAFDDFYRLFLCRLQVSEISLFGRPLIIQK
jgi:hypothetical protein